MESENLKETQVISEWEREVRRVEESLRECRKARNYYETRRKKMKIVLDDLMSRDPRQIRLDI